MTLSGTLNRYLARAFLVNLMAMLAALLGIVYLFDTVELLRRAGKAGGIPLAVVLEMGLLKLPDVGQMILPFAVLFSAMFTFWQLNRRSELIVMRSSGFSVWQFLAPVLGVALGAGLVYLAAVNPLGAAMIARYEAMEDKLLYHRTSSVTLLKEGLWLRQDGKDGRYIIHAGRVSLPDWLLHDVTVFYFGAGDDFKERLDAPVARLDDGHWTLEKAVANSPGRAAAQAGNIAVPTDMTSKDIEESFSSPATVSFWQLPGFIDTLESTGFDATPLKIHFHSLLAQPLTFAAMVLLAAVVSLRPPRFRGAFVMILAGVCAGFLVFFSGSFLQALGTAHQIPVLAASWVPPLVAGLLGVAILLHVEDG